MSKFGNFIKIFYLHFLYISVIIFEWIKLYTMKDDFYEQIFLGKP